MSSPLIGLMGSEWRKVATTKVFWMLGLAAIAFSALNVVILVLVAPDSGMQLGIPDPLMEPGYLTSVIATAGSASVFVLILGIIGMTGEYRHMTITSTFLATPRRGQVILAKSVTYAILGALIAVANVAVVVVLAMITLAGKEHAPLESGTIGMVLFGVTLGMAIYAVLGVSIGALMKNQVGAIVTAIIWVFLVEALLSVFVDGISKWLPGGALNATMDVTTTRDMSAANLLPVWGGALLLLAYAVVFATIASLTTVRRDIT